jgi:hypothetical protein
MRASAQQSHVRQFSYDADGELDTGPRFLEGELSVGERVGRPLKRRRRRLLRTALVLVVAFGGAWGVLGHPSTWPVQRWAATIKAQASAVFAALERKAPEASTAAVSQPPVAEQLQPLAEEKPLPAAPEPAPAAKAPSLPPPVAPDAFEASPIVTGALPAATKAPPPPLPPPTVDRSDPYQVKAEAVGLHPGLSRVLLKRMSQTDYRNAGYAIKTALAETSEGGSFLWPRQRKGGLALFKVHFVQGAGPECRRYVVTITQDGWATTAFPMEKCGPQFASKRRASR